MIQFHDVTLRVSERVLFSAASFAIHPGWRAGITGANGTGKSTLLRALKGQLGTDQGRIDLPGGWVIAEVAQETQASPRSALDFAIDGDQPLRLAQQQLADAEARDEGAAIAAAHMQIEACNGYTANARGSAMLHGLGFSQADLTRPVADFSGGWRMRLNLARALMCPSDLLLLDEPTNHLDLDAVIWLEGWLSRYPGTLLLIAHDREFLDAVVGHILHLDGQSATLYNGNYSTFERRRAEQLAGQQAAYVRQQRAISHMRSFVDRFRAQATKARQAQSRLKALSRMEEILPAHIDSPFEFQFFQPERQPNPMLQLEEASFAYSAEKQLLKNFTLSILPGARIGLIGPNGAGKTTLLRLLSGDLSPTSGRRWLARETRVGYFAQHQLEQLEADKTPVAHLMALDANLNEERARGFLGGFGFAGDRVFSACGVFSGGEKARLVLALIVYQKPCLLLLDEPTNHLDMDMRQALGLALQDFAGAVVLISHDRHLLRSTCDDLYLVDSGQAQPFAGDLEDYALWLSSRTTSDSVDTGDDSANRPDRRQMRRDNAVKREALKPLKKALEKSEKQLEKVQTQRAQKEQKLAEPELYLAENKAQLQTLMSEVAALKKAEEDAEELWLNAATAYEEAGG